MELHDTNHSSGLVISHTPRPTSQHAADTARPGSGLSQQADLQLSLISEQQQEILLLKSMLEAQDVMLEAQDVMLEAMRVQLARHGTGECAGLFGEARPQHIGINSSFLRILYSQIANQEIGIMLIYHAHGRCEF